MDFVALLRYSRTRSVVRAIAGLENQTVPVSAEVQRLWREQGFFQLRWGRAYWVSHTDSRQVKRPRGPDLTAALRTVDGFFLTFGQGVCCVYHLLRWRQFLTDPQWQHAMLAACGALAELLQAPDGVVMSDYHPGYQAFFAGAGYDACLRDLPPGEGEVDTIAGLYQRVDPDMWDSHGYWVFR
jgi:hypothetical protein